MLSKRDKAPATLQDQGTALSFFFDSHRLLLCQRELTNAQSVVPSFLLASLTIPYTLPTHSHQASFAPFPSIRTTHSAPHSTWNGLCSPLPLPPIHTHTHFHHLITSSLLFLLFALPLLSLDFCYFSSSSPNPIPSSSHPPTTHIHHIHTGSSPLTQTRPFSLSLFSLFFPPPRPKLNVQQEDRDWRHHLCQPALYTTGAGRARCIWLSLQRVNVNFVGMYPQSFECSFRHTHLSPRKLT